MMFEIPLDSALQGIMLCKDNVRHLLDDARTLVKKNTSQSNSHAVALVVLAIEELGKAKVLSDHLQQAKKRGMNFVEVNESLFKLHKPKFKEGCSLLPPDSLVIEKAQYNPKQYNPDQYLTEDVEVNPEIRLEATFVNWNDTKKRWKIGTPASTGKIERLITEIENAVEKI
jgi:AbiV family abortive infection protein